MRHIPSETLASSRTFFDVLHTTSRCQIATMTLAPGQASGEMGSDHPHADQLLVVISGTGEATVSGAKVRLSPGDVLLIEAGEPHQVRGVEEPFVSLNFYAPVAYPEEG